MTFKEDSTMPVEKRLPINRNPLPEIELNLLPPYCSSGRSMLPIKGVLIHYFSAKNVDPPNEFDMHACYHLFMDLNRTKANRQRYMLSEKWPQQRFYASAHVLIGRDGSIWELVKLNKEAWHAGKGMINGISNLNRQSYGIELIGKRGSGFTPQQYEKLAKLLRYLEEIHGFPRENIMGHDQARWAAIQAGHKAKAKYDPSGIQDGSGNNFDWLLLAQLMNKNWSEL